MQIQTTFIVTQVVYRRSNKISGIFSYIGTILAIQFV